MVGGCWINAEVPDVELVLAAFVAVIGINDGGAVGDVGDDLVVYLVVFWWWIWSMIGDECWMLLMMENDDLVQVLVVDMIINHG